jgi:hypothetical protein
MVVPDYQHQVLSDNFHIYCQSKIQNILVIKIVILILIKINKELLE